MKYQYVLLSLRICSHTSLDSASQNDSSFHIPGTVGHDTIRDPPACLPIGCPTSATSKPQHGSTSKLAGTTEDSTTEKLPTPDVGKTPFQPKKSNSLNGRLEKQRLYTEAFKLPGLISGYGFTMTNLLTRHSVTFMLQPTNII